MKTEKAIICRMLMDKDTIPCAKILIRATDFESDSLRAMFTAMVQLYDEGRPVDLVTVQDKLSEMGVNPNIAGLDKLKEIMEVVQ